jgi:hypothetical protein
VSEQNIKPTELVTDLKDWVASQDYVKRNVFPVVIRGVSSNAIENSLIRETFNQGLKSFFETQLSKISGLVSGFDLDRDKKLINFINPQVKVLAAEKYGCPIERLFQEWGKIISETLESSEVDCSIDVMFIEPDPSHTVVVNAWLCTNLLPASFRTSEGVLDKRDTVKNLVIHTIKMSHKTDQGEDVIAMASELLKNINFDPYIAPPLYLAMTHGLPLSSSGLNRLMEEHQQCHNKKIDEIAEKHLINSLVSSSFHEVFSVYKNNGAWKYGNPTWPMDAQIPKSVNLQPMKILMDFPNAKLLGPFIYDLGYHDDNLVIISIHNPNIHDFKVVIDVDISFPDAKPVSVFVYSRNDPGLVSTFNRLFKGIEFSLTTKIISSQDRHLEIKYLNDEKKD